MPHLTLPISPAGCALDVVVGISDPRAAALKAANKSVPPVKQARVILDTGATVSAIDEVVLKSLGLTPTGTTQIHTPSTKGNPIICPT
jgi:hypothetical protein